MTKEQINLIMKAFIIVLLFVLIIIRFIECEESKEIGIETEIEDVGLVDWVEWTNRYMEAAELVDDDHTAWYGLPEYRMKDNPDIGHDNTYIGQQETEPKEPSKRPIRRGSGPPPNEPNDKDQLDKKYITFSEHVLLRENIIIHHPSEIPDIHIRVPCKKIPEDYGECFIEIVVNTKLILGAGEETEQ